MNKKMQWGKSRSQKEKRRKSNKMKVSNFRDQKFNKLKNLQAEWKLKSQNQELLYWF